MTTQIGTIWLPEDFYNGPPRRILVCGSRGWYDTGIIRAYLSEFVPKDASADEPTIIHGDAVGADRIAAYVALDLGLWVEAHPANWKKHGKAAGPIRNVRMLDTRPDCVLAFQAGQSAGTQHTVREARKRGIPVRVIHRCGAECHHVGGEAGCIHLTAA